MKFSTPELLARRLISQGLARSQARPAFDTPAAAAAGLLAVQGQNYAGGIRALALRSGSSDEEVLAAVDRLEIVRSWPQRGTLHFLAAEDATWLARLLHPRIMNTQAQRQPAATRAVEEADEDQRQLKHKREVHGQGTEAGGAWKMT